MSRPRPGPRTVVMVLSRPCREFSRPLRRAAVAVLLAAAASACAETSDGPLVVEASVAETTTTTLPEAPTETPRSEGTVEIGETVYRFTVTCQERGAGEVVVIGAGDDPDADGLVKLYVQASLSDPYIGLELGDGITRIEPSLDLDSPLDLYVQDDVIRASAIRFVRDLQLETGEATDVGFGQLEIHCYSYENELPS